MSDELTINNVDCGKVLRKIANGTDDGSIRVNNMNFGEEWIDDVDKNKLTLEISYFVVDEEDEQ